MYSLYKHLQIYKVYILINVIYFPGCGSREKRSTDVEAVITLTISLDQGDNLDLDKYMSNKTSNYHE